MFNLYTFIVFLCELCVFAVQLFFFSLRFFKLRFTFLHPAAEHSSQLIHLAAENLVFLDPDYFQVMSQTNVDPQPLQPHIGFF